MVRSAIRPDSARIRWLLPAVATLVLALASILIVAHHPETIIPGDTVAYRNRISSILERGWPYLDVPFEHLPLMLVPMFLAWILGGWVSQTDYVTVFASLMSLTLVLTSVFMEGIGRSLAVRRVGWRWVIATGLLVPLAVFRNDPVPLFLATAGIWALLRGRSGWWLWAIGGAAAKVWPASLAVASWPRQKARSMVVAISGIIAVAWTFLPGFVSARGPQGLHAETVVGALFGLARTAARRTAHVTVTTAAYIDVPGWAVVLNTLIGLSVVVLASIVVVRAHDVREKLLGTGAVVVGIMLTAGVLSLQYVLWLTPFVALSNRRVLLATMVVLAGMSTTLAWAWNASMFEGPGSYSAFTARNFLLIVSAVLLAREASSSRSCQRSRSFIGADPTSSDDS